MTRARVFGKHTTHRTSSDAPAPPGDTTATGPAGIAGDERRAARWTGRSVATHLARAAALFALVAGVVGTVSTTSAAAQVSLSANRVQAYAGALGVGPNPGTPFHAAMKG